MRYGIQGKLIDFGIKDILKDDRFLSKEDFSPKTFLL